MAEIKFRAKASFKAEIPDEMFERFKKCVETENEEEIYKIIDDEIVKYLHEHLKNAIPYRFDEITYVEDYEAEC